MGGNLEGTQLNLLHFLIVEDHAFQRSMLEKLLRGLGAQEVRCAGNGAEAMRILRDPAARVDVVITDLMMPDVDGIELLPLLRNSATPVSLVLTSVDNAVLCAAAEIAKGHGVRVLGTIVKPVTSAELQPLLDRYIADRVSS